MPALQDRPFKVYLKACSVAEPGSFSGGIWLQLIVYNTVCTRKYGIQMLYNCIGNFVQPIDLSNIAKEKKKIKKEFCMRLANCMLSILSFLHF